MTTLNISRDDLYEDAQYLFETIFDQALTQGLGEVEIRIFTKGRIPEQYFYSSIDDVVDKAYDLTSEGIDVFFGVNPRVGKGGGKENVKYVTVFHAEVDYGKIGHKKKTPHESYDDALAVISKFSPEPTIIVHSGGGFHCYWVLNEPLKVEDTGLDNIETINRTLCKILGGDSGTHDISRVLRVPGTYNHKEADNPRKATVLRNSGAKYNYEDFTQFLAQPDDKQKVTETEPTSTATEESTSTWDGSIDNLQVSPKIKDLILKGNDGTYSSRSEADMAVIIALVSKGVGDDAIREIFQNYPIGEKYREHSSPEKYLEHTIREAKKLSNLTEEERQNPLFISGSLNKSDKGIKLDVVKYQEYIVKKYEIKKVGDAYFKYNGKCYEQCTEDDLNVICQQELSNYRRLFKSSTFKELKHYAICDAKVDDKKAQDDQVNYLTLKNGLYSLKDEKLSNHTSDIFTTNELPYKYDPDAMCLRFLRYLDEVFLKDTEKINFVQEVVGYALHKSIPMPAIFFLVGSGSNGKSVFTDVLTYLFGESNTSSISLNALSNEYYLLQLFGKMINISAETPRKRKLNTDIIKAVVGGDIITARSPHKDPFKFRSYAKHYLAMNEKPDIDDTSHGMWRRIYMIEFPRTFSKEEMDVDLIDELRKELSGIFNWALEGYRSLRKKSFKLKETMTMEELKQQYKNDTNSVLSFASQRLLLVDSDNRVKLKDVYDKYKRFCETEGCNYVYQKTEFKRILKGNKYLIDRSTRDSNQLCILGVKIVSDD